MLEEFREFINRGNVVELAVAFVMGVAFKPIIDNIVNRIVMPVIGMLVGQPNVDTVGTFACEPGLDPTTNIVTADTVCAGSVGAVLTATINFLLIAVALFFVVKAYNRMNRQVPPEPEPEAEPEDVALLREIRDSLRTPRP